VKSTLTEPDTQPPESQSQSVEDFLKAVYVLQQRMERVTTNALADALNISAPSVTDMARRMVASGLVDYRKYYGVLLTPEGEAVALRVIRRHRLIELYLVEELGYDLHEVHEEAEKLEHAVSDSFIQAIAAKLGDPEIDPHGDPIPAPDGTITRRDTVPLSELAPGDRARVSRLRAEDNDMLQHILDRGFALGATIELISRDPFDGPLTASIEGVERIIGHTVAGCIQVEMLDPQENSDEEPSS
jgi:DtxR family transcriptional regulator, Mn-dependent transcriptional regulator